MALDLEKQQMEFLDICHTNIQREGLAGLVNWLMTADFFRAPASTRFHGAYPGGLCQHSLDVYNYALRASNLVDQPLDLESLTVASLFHDVCKVNFYKVDRRNQKVNGVWTEVPYYTIEEKFAFGGHGSKSVFLVERFMRLKTDEAIAINCHMGFSDQGNVSSISQAYERCPLAWVIHVADEAATWMLHRTSDDEENA
ncbi:MAG: HD domain-containing protein [Clostridia bacterium]|nr:HD domain-containing protein [Clostridia bacterium]